MLDNTYLILPEKIATDCDLTPISRLIFAKIYGLSKSDGYCWATNKYLSQYFNVSIRTISMSISTLYKKKYISIFGNNSKRKIYINYSMIEN